jgi:hypothetical protein
MSEDGMSQREIAGVLGVDPSTINRDLSVANATESRELSRESVANATKPAVTIAEKIAPILVDSTNIGSAYDLQAPIRNAVRQ